jgi:hypothetical protein
MIASVKRGRVLGIAGKISVFILILANISIVLGQSKNRLIVSVGKGKMGVINAGYNSGIASGQKYTLKRNTSSGIIEVGEVIIEKTLADKSGIRLIEERESNSINKGDFLIKDEDKGTFSQGKMDGERDGKAAGAGAGWYFIGCASPMWAYVLEPDVPSAGALMGKSSEYIQGYNEGYKKKVRGERTKKAWYGCIAGGVIYCGIYAIAIAGATAATTPAN